jgi:hypothetical protein
MANEQRVEDARAGAWAGVAAPVVWLGGALVMSHVDQHFMDQLGWDVWPSGLALGPHGWGQVVIFLVFAAVYAAFAVQVSRSCRWSRLARWGGRLMVVGACLSPFLAFKTDPPGAQMTWHGALHAAGYVTLMVSMLVAFVSVYPGLIRRTSPQAWRVAPLALLLVPPAWLAPNSTATSSYLFFAVPFTLLAALALVLTTMQASPADVEPEVPEKTAEAGDRL